MKKIYQDGRLAAALMSAAATSSWYHAWNHGGGFVNIVASIWITLVALYFIFVL